MSLARTLHRAALAGLLICASVAASAATLPSGFSETRVATGVASPTAMAFAPDGRLFVAQQGGQLRVIRNGALLATPFVTVNVNASGERGLLGIAFDPNFASNGFVYLYYTTASAPVHNRLSRFTASAANPDVAAAGSEVQLLNLPSLSSATNHNGGAIHFGNDGRLYVAVGDNANSANSQTLNTTLGKLLRINADGSIPSDNPFFSQTSGINRAIYALGLRNPFNFAIDATNGRIHVNDVGQDAWEEVNLLAAGVNFGWPQTEGPNPPGVAGVRYPIYNYQNAASNCAITGAAFYRPSTPTFPAEYAGRYFFADFCGGAMRMLSAPGYNSAVTFATGISSPVDIQVASDGALWYLARGNGGEVFRVQNTGAVAPTISSHPANATVSAGQSASFTVNASGTAPLQYQWLRNGQVIPSATSQTLTIPMASAADNGAVFRATVSNAAGSVQSNPATLTVLSNAAPSGRISWPPNNTTYGGGQSFTFYGTATDPEDGQLPASAFTWRVDFHHDDHTHPHVLPFGNATVGTFTASDRGETSANVFYRVVMTVRDSAGLSHTSSIDFRPRTSIVRLESNIANAQLTLDGTPVTAPVQFTGVEGVIRSIGVVSPQTTGGTSYEFVQWSDGGATTHEITTPVNDSTYTALLQPAIGTSVFSDNFEVDRGWTLTPGANMAVRGRWERGDPDSTSAGATTLQRGTCDGSTGNCFITGLAAGASNGANDIDGGGTSIQSPAIALPAGATLTLSLRYYLAHLNNATNADYFRVRVVGANGVPQTVFTRFGSASTLAGAWTTQSVNLSAFAGQTVRLRIEAADAGTASLVEAGVDNVQIRR